MPFFHRGFQEYDLGHAPKTPFETNKDSPQTEGLKFFVPNFADIPGVDYSDYGVEPTVTGVLAQEAIPALGVDAVRMTGTQKLDYGNTDDDPGF